MAGIGGGVDKGFDDPMSRTEAAKILGIRQGNVKFADIFSQLVGRQGHSCQSAPETHDPEPS
eukprot:749283-Hanusia_phi.AAC.2